MKPIKILSPEDQLEFNYDEESSVISINFPKELLAQFNKVVVTVGGRTIGEVDTSRIGEATVEAFYKNDSTTGYAADADAICNKCYIGEYCKTRRQQIRCCEHLYNYLKKTKGAEING